MNRYLTSTILLRYIENRLGYKFEDLELSPEDIIENIIQESIPEFSKKFPYMFRHLINPVLDRTPDIQNKYYLNLPDKYVVIGVNKCFILNDLSGGDFIGIRTTNTGGVYSSQLMADLSSANTVPVAPMYCEDDGTLEIVPNSITNQMILVEVKCLHFEDFTTIPFTMQNEFKKLALYDTQISLLPLRRRFSNLSTSFGNIEVFISDLEEAQSKRDELLENWRKNFYKSPTRKKLYIA